MISALARGVSTMEAKLDRYPLPDRHRLRWEPEPPDLPELDAWFAGDSSRVEQVKDNGKRSVYALRRTADGPPTCYLKYDHPQGLRDVVKTLLRPRIRREYRAGRALAEAGLAVAEPLACGWRGTRGILLLAAIPEARPSQELWHSIRGTPYRQAYLDAFGQFLHDLLAAGTWHPDMHLGNVLASGAVEKPTFYLIDLYGARLVGALSGRRIASMLAIVTELSDDLSRAERLALLRQIRPAADPEALWERLLDARIRDTRQRWHGRRRKILGDSGRVRLDRTGDGVLRWRAETDRRVVEAAIAAHRNLVFNAPDDLLKLDTKRNLSRVAVTGTYYVVKEWKQPGPWGKFAADHRAWVANWRLELAGFRVPAFLGWLRRKDGHAYIVMPEIPGRTFDRELLACVDDEAKTTALLTALGELLESLYRWDILHQDFKLQNIIVSGWNVDQPQLTLIDNDAVRFGTPISQADRARNRREMLESVVSPVAPIRPLIEQFLERCPSS